MNNNEQKNILETAIEYIKRDITEIKDTLKEMRGDFVLQAEFRPVKMLVYGMVGLILMSVVTALMALVIIK